MNRYLLSFDDTDELNMPGTGHLLDSFLQTLPAKCSFISRHQLFVHADVPYTSHNSAMCAQIDGQLSAEELIDRAAAYLEQHSAPGADPGLCVAAWQTMTQRELLVLWGYRAKREVLAKEDAYALAQQCGVHLSEHGGTGQGVVGALAAVGLRLAGDAWYHGVLHKKPYIGDPVREIGVEDIPLACKLLYASAALALVLCAAVKLLFVIGW